MGIKLVRFDRILARHGLVHLLIAVALLFGSAQLLQAQPASNAADKPIESPKPLKPLSDETALMLQQKLSGLEADIAEIRMLDQRLMKEPKDFVDEVQIARLDRIWLTTLKNAVDFAGTVADLRDQNYDVGPFLDKAVVFVSELPTAVRVAVDRRSARIVLPSSSLPAAEQAQVDEKFFTATSAIISSYKSLLTSIGLAKRLGIDTEAEEEFLRSKVVNAATNASVYLDIAQADVTGLRAAVAVLPDDKELAAELKISLLRVKRTAALLESIVGQMKQLNVPAAQFSQQLVTVTGAISANILDIEVISGLVSANLERFKELLLEKGPNFVLQFLTFLLIVYLFFKLAGLVQRLLQRAIDKSGTDISFLLRDMILASSRNLIIALGVLIALAQLGISLGPLLAGLGIAGFIIGFALQDALANFASGMMILFYRPFDVGDTIEVTSARGKVSHMSLVNTTILTFDNQSLVVPNNKIWQDVIKNVTARNTRRIDMAFGIAYDQDIDAVEKLLFELLNADNRVLKDPEPVVKVGSFGDSSVEILCRPWVRTDDYWEVMWDLNKKVKQAFDQAGISIPFPQRDVHLYRHDMPATGGADT